MLRTSATFSDDRVYRYTLTRTWSETDGDFFDDPVYACWVMLNPSTADETQDDPTIRRCIGFSRQWGFDGLQVVNIFALRSTDPKALYTHPDPVGPDNDRAIHVASHLADVTFVAWGVHGALRGRGAGVARLLKNAHCLGVTKDGHPKHPLYLKGDTRPLAYPA